MAENLDLELFGEPLSLDSLPQTSGFCSEIGGYAPDLFAALIPFFQRRFESALTTLDNNISIESVAGHFRARLRKDKQGHGVLGVIGEVVAASIYSDTVGPVQLIPEKETKDVDFVGKHDEYETQNEVKFFWDNFANPPRPASAESEQIEWPASTRNLSFDPDAYDRAVEDNKKREPKDRVKVKISRAADLFEKLALAVSPKFQEANINLVWLYSQNTNMADVVANQLAAAVSKEIEDGSELSRRISAIVWYTLSEEDPILFFWENPDATTEVPAKVSGPLQKEAERVQEKIREERDRKLREYGKERNEWYAGRKRGERTKFT